MITLPYLDAYIDRLRQHDWFYAYSDDPRVFKAGQAAAQKLQREGEASPLLRDLYECAAFAIGADRSDEYRGKWQCWLTFPEFCEVTQIGRAHV